MARDKAKKGDQPRAATGGTNPPAATGAKNPPAATGGKNPRAATGGKNARATSRGAKTAAKPTGGQHHAAKAHGQPARVDTSLPATREELLELHAAARSRRAAAALDSAEFRQAVDEIGRIEVRVASIERDQVPPKG